MPSVGVLARGVEPSRCLVAYLLAIRNPVSVADSLQKRDGMDRTQSYLLWLTLTLNSVSLTKDQKRVVMNYDRLIKAPEEQVRRVADRLNLKVEEEQLNAYVANFLDSNLRHTRHTQADLASDPDCPVLVLGLYRDLLAVSQHKEDLGYRHRSTTLETGLEGGAGFITNFAFNGPAAG